MRARRLKPLAHITKSFTQTNNGDRERERKRERKKMKRRDAVKGEYCERFRFSFRNEVLERTQHSIGETKDFVCSH